MLKVHQTGLIGLKEIMIPMLLYFFYDEDLECYRGEGDIVASKGETLKEAVYNAKQIAKNYDRYVYDRVKFKESIDYNETDLDSLGELKIYWHTR